MAAPERELERMARRIRRCTACPLHASRRRAVPGEGDASAPIMLIGEAPGAEEDAAGRPFVGRSGRYLREIARIAGLDDARLFITGCVKCHPPGNRAPGAQEVRTCRTLWLERQISIIDPGVILLLGRTASRSMLGPATRGRDALGRVFDLGGRRVIAAPHPAWAMRFGRRDAALHDALRLAAETASF